MFTLRAKSVIPARVARAILPALSVAVALLACAAARGQEPPTYRLTPVDSGQAGTYVVTRSVNERGEIAGQMLGGAAGSRPVLWTPAGGTVVLRDFTGNPAATGFGVGINDLGQVAGTVNGRAAFWTTATGRAAAAAAEPSQGNDINNAGVVVGVEILNGGADTRAFRRLADGTLQYVSDPNLTQTVGLALNSAGYVSGLSRTNPFVWAPDGTVTPLQGINSNVFGMAHRINDSNWVVGAEILPNQNTVALLWRRGEEPTEIVGLPGATGGSVPEGLNNAGMVVGSSNLGTPRAFVWTEEWGALDLNRMLDETGDGWVLTNAFDVNNRGQIVGQGLYQGQLRGFLLTPVPEPAGALAIATAAGGLVLRRRRKA
jgi:hypothetical protein